MRRNWFEGAVQVWIVFGDPLAAEPEPLTMSDWIDHRVAAGPAELTHSIAEVRVIYYGDKSVYLKVIGFNEAKAVAEWSKFRERLHLIGGL